MEKLLTVAIPSYNVEKYLEQTLSSFLIDPQWLKKTEILIVNDGSSDRTEEIGRKYEQKYPEVFRVITKENGGHGSAINRGILESKGKYFKVVDGDDWVETQGFENLVKELENCRCDFVITNYYEVNDATKARKEKSFRQIPGKKVLNIREVLEKIQIPMHGLTIRTELLKKNKIRLDEHCFYVDVEYILFPVPYAESVWYLDEYVYMYRLAVATQSVSMAGYQKHLQNHIDVVLHLADFLSAYMEKGGDPAKINYMCTRISQMARDQADIFMSFPASDKEIRKKFKKFDEELKKRNLKVYEQTGTYSGMLRLLRKTCFLGYRKTALRGGAGRYVRGLMLSESQMNGIGGFTPICRNNKGIHLQVFHSPRLRDCHHCRV